MTGWVTRRRELVSQGKARASAEALRRYWYSPEITLTASAQYGFHFTDDRGETISSARIRSWEGRGWIVRVAHPQPFGEGRAFPITWGLTDSGREVMQQEETDD